MPKPEGPPVYTNGHASLIETRPLQLTTTADVLRVDPPEVILWTAPVTGQAMDESLRHDVLQNESVGKLLKTNPGFVPDAYPPSLLGKLLEKEIEKKQAHENPPIDGLPVNDVVHIDTHNMKERPRYDGPNNRLSLVARMGVYNSVIGETGTLHNRNLHDPEMKPILDRVKETLANGSFSVLLPFAAEPNTIGPNIDYAKSRVGEGNVFAISAGVHPESDQKARETGVTVIDQKRVLAAIDWERLKTEGVFPSRFSVPPKGSKGFTMLAGLIALKALGRLEQTTVAFHDTDITNPVEYAALEHMALPYTFPIGETHSTYVARTGEGRNNEPWVLAGNLAAMDHQNTESMKTGLLMGSFTWPLTGERTLSGTIQTAYGEKPVAEALPWSNGMGIETTLNVNVAGMDAVSGTREVMEVMNPNPKIEDRVSPRDREFAIVFRCATQLQALTKDADRFQTPLHEWTLQQIGEHNKWYGGIRTSQAVPSGEDSHQPNMYVDMETDYILPSIAQMEALGIIDFDKIRASIKIPGAFPK